MKQSCVKFSVAANCPRLFAQWFSSHAVTTWQKPTFLQKYSLLMFYFIYRKPGQGDGWTVLWSDPLRSSHHMPGLVQSVWICRLVSSPRVSRLLSLSAPHQWCERVIQNITLCPNDCTFDELTSESISFSVGFYNHYKGWPLSVGRLQRCNGND